MGIFNLLFKRNPRVPLDVIEAADRGDESAKRKLNEAFDKGLTAEEHNELRRQAYGPKANAGDPFAQYWMGFLSSMIDRNATQAIYWYECSAKQGNVEAMRALAFGYGEFLNTADLGYGPVSLGREAAQELYWLKMAADYGDEKSVQDLQERCQF